MKQHPILFSTPMVQAILEGRKTQTRRMTNLNQINECPEKWKFEVMDKIITCDLKHISGAIFNINGTNLRNIFGCPYGQVGDILWVRETWAKVIIWGTDDVPPSDLQPEFIYKATEGNFIEDNEGNTIKWKPSIHMPKAACRIWLQITDIRVERLQNITEQDAIAEGALTLTPTDDLPAKVRYHMLWDIINGPDSWNKNPWVWIIEFKKIEKP